MENTDKSTCEYFIGTDNMGKYCTVKDSCPYGKYQISHGNKDIGNTCGVNGKPTRLEEIASIPQEE